MTDRIKVTVNEVQPIQVTIRNVVDLGNGATGDMLKSVYDPTSVAGDAFAMGNMVESTDANILTDLERAAIASGGSAGPWELVTTEVVSGSAVQEILFDSLDFTTYDYNLGGIIVGTATNSSNWRWYATEATAAAVTTSNYITNRALLVTSVFDSQANDNRLIFTNYTNIQALLLSDYTFLRDSNGFTHMFGGQAVEVRSGSTSTLAFAQTAHNNQSTVSPTHIGIYNSGGANLDVGTRLTLSRRLRA